MALNMNPATSFPTRLRRSTWLAATLCAWLAATSAVEACPFCIATSQTLSEELASAQVAVIARLSQAAPPTESGAADPTTGLATFEVVEILRGADKFSDLKELAVVYFGENEADKLFLINGIDAGLPPTAAGQAADWTTPLPLSQRGVEYVRQLATLPPQGTERLAFFLQYFEDADPLLAQDAYDEFARAPYRDVIELGPQLDRVQLMQWIDNPEIGPTRRRLYLTLFGMCGQAEDSDKLETMLKYDFQQMKPALGALVSVMGFHGSALGASVAAEIVQADVRRQQQCLDALIAAYLKLKGPAGLPLIEERFLANPDAEYTQVYATIMALRFHGEETDILPRERLLQAMRLALDNSEISDQVIPDLARWEDWSILDRLVTMFNESEADAWIRQPVISYVLTAAEQPGDVGQRANAALAEIEALDPEGVKRARSYLSFGMLGRSTSTAAAPGPEEIDQVPAGPAEEEAVKTTTVGDQPAPATLLATTAPVPSRATLIAAPLMACVVLMGIFALLLRSADVRGSSDAT